MDKDKNITYKD